MSSVEDPVAAVAANHEESKADTNSSDSSPEDPGDDDDDEQSVVERNSDDDDEDRNYEAELDALANQSSQGSSSVVEKDAETELGAQSQVPRGFMERVFWNESDVRFTNDTDREVLFIIADEEFTLQRTTNRSASLSNDDDDDDDETPNLQNLVDAAMNSFGLNFVPLKATLSVGASTTKSQQALRTRCMPVAPKSHSTQHFQSERLTYVTAMSKDVDGEGHPWTRVHYENKVINCQRTKSLKFSRKHLKVSAYRIQNDPHQPPHQQHLRQAGSVSPLLLTNGKRSPQKRNSSDSSPKSRKKHCAQTID